jgi:anti-sigma B factor antagonist
VELKLSQRDATGRAPVNVVALTGEVDLHSAPKLRDELDGLLTGEAPVLVLDLDEVGFLDSTGLGALVAARGAALDRGGAFELVCTRPRIAKLFTITGLDSVFRLHSSVDEAISSLVS